MAALAALSGGCCLRPGPEDAGSGTSTGAGSNSGTSGSIGSSSAGDGGLTCGVGTYRFCDEIGGLGPNAYFGPGLMPYCVEVLCPACGAADSEVLGLVGAQPDAGPDAGSDAGSLDWTSPSFLGGRCPWGLGTWDLRVLECLIEDGPKVLSPGCAAALTSVVEANTVYKLDGGACEYAGPEEGNGVDFCSAIGGCIGDSAFCEDAVCKACSIIDGITLGGVGSDGGTFFGGLCPPVSAASPCADFQCFMDAGPRVLSPGCAAAVASLAERFLDGGSDGG